MQKITELPGLDGNAFSSSKRLYKNIKSPSEQLSGGVILFPQNADCVPHIGKINAALSSHTHVTCVIGHFLRGNYTAPNGEKYGDQSLSIELTGVTSAVLKEITLKLLQTLNQDSALIKDRNSGKIIVV